MPHRSSQPYGWRAQLAGVLYLLDPPPCIVPLRCRHYQSCAKWHLACEDFVDYARVRDSRNLPIVGREPSRELYNKLYPD